MRLTRPMSIVLIATVLSGLGLLLPPTNNPVIITIRTVAAFVAIGFLPGLVWSYVFWPIATITNIERVFLSIVLSLVLVPLVTFILYRLSLPISPLSTVSAWLIVVGPGLMLWWRRLSHARA